MQACPVSSVAMTEDGSTLCLTGGAAVIVYSLLKADDDFLVFIIHWDAPIYLWLPCAGLPSELRCHRRGRLDPLLNRWRGRQRLLPSARQVSKVHRAGESLRRQRHRGGLFVRQRYRGGGRGLGSGGYCGELGALCVHPGAPHPTWEPHCRIQNWTRAEFWRISGETLKGALCA